MESQKHLTYGKIEIDGRCLDLLFTDNEIARATKRAYDPENAHLIPENANTCWPIEKPPECSFWNRIIGKCK
jgi:hypothetical protein